MSTFITDFFRKPLEKITIEDIESLFSTTQHETPTLEFKSGEVELSSIYQEITALHNTDGGLLILGAPRGDKNGCGGKLRPSPLGRIKLVQGIGSHVVPPPIGILVHPIPCDGGHIYLIHVPKSSNPPHQFEGIYYVRFDEESRRAPHGFVEAMFQKRRIPILVSKTAIEHKNGYAVLTVDITNSSMIPAHKVNYSITVTGRADKMQILERPITITSIAHTVTTDLVSQSALDKIEGIFVRGMLIQRKVIVKVARNSKYLHVAVELWSRDTELASIYSVFRIVKEKLETEESDVGRENLEKHLSEFLKLEANATDR